jgi:hypothetical protein
MSFFSFMKKKRAEQVLVGVGGRVVSVGGEECGEGM